MTRKIPSFNCGGCTACCTVVPFRPHEKEAAALRKPFLAWTEMKSLRSGPGFVPTAAWEAFQSGDHKNARCPFVDDEQGRCTIYDIRPLICRLYGTVKDNPRMQCAMGRAPKRNKMLTDAEARAMLEEKP